MTNEIEKDYFIMMSNPTGKGASPIVNGEYKEVMFFETEEEARELAEDHHACSHFGYEIFCLGCGE